MTAIELLRRLVFEEPYVADQQGCRECAYCITNISYWPHAPDCPWVAARAWLEEPKTIDSGAMTISLLIDRLSALRDTHGDLTVWGNSEWEYAFTCVAFAEAGKDHYHGEIMPDRIEIT